jgi:hypothetical protein
VITVVKNIIYWILIVGLITLCGVLLLNIITVVSLFNILENLL